MGRGTNDYMLPWRRNHGILTRTGELNTELRTAAAKAEDDARAAKEVRITTENGDYLAAIKRLINHFVITLVFTCQGT